MNDLYCSGNDICQITFLHMSFMHRTQLVLQQPWSQSLYPLLFLSTYFVIHSGKRTVNLISIDLTSLIPDYDDFARIFITDSVNFPEPGLLSECIITF